MFTGIRPDTIRRVPLIDWRNKHLLNAAGSSAAGRAISLNLKD
jgi:hypothetical protein